MPPSFQLFRSVVTKVALGLLWAALWSSAVRAETPRGTTELSTPCRGKLLGPVPEDTAVPIRPGRPYPAPVLMSARQSLWEAKTILGGFYQRRYQFTGPDTSFAQPRAKWRDGVLVQNAEEKALNALKYEAFSFLLWSFSRPVMLVFICHVMSRCLLGIFSR